MSIAMKTLLVLVVVAILGGDKDDPEPAKAPPKADIRGKVTTVAALKAKGLVGRIRVEGKKEKDTGYDDAMVTIPSTAKIYLWEAGKKKDAKFSDIKRGTRVQCVFTGPVTRSIPPQARASEVLILEQPKKEK
jgi:hypothetical protein